MNNTLNLQGERINTADKFVNGILTNDRNKKVR